MSKVTKVIGLVSAVMVLGIFVAAFCEKLGMVRLVSRTDAQLRALGGGFTNGRRSAEGEMHASLNRASFDGAKLREAVAILQAINKDDRVTGLFIDLQDARVSDADMVTIEGLSKLKAIDLGGTAVTRKGMLTLKQKYPDIRIYTNNWHPKTSNSHGQFIQ